MTTTATKNKHGAPKKTKANKSSSSKTLVVPTDNVQEALQDAPEVSKSRPEPEQAPEPVQTFEDRVEAARSCFWAKALFSAILNKNLLMHEDREVALDATVQHMVRRRK